jgi:hypothetical protein
MGETDSKKLKKEAADSSLLFQPTCLDLKAQFKYYCPVPGS